jgi:hypothetical protein
MASVTKAYIADDCAFDERQPRPTIDVTEPDEKLIDTGLLDASGNTLYRVRRPVGFR